MKNEPVSFKTENNNSYFYDPVLKEIFIYNNDLFKQCQNACRNLPVEPYQYERISPELVEYQLANLPQVTIEMTERCNLNCHYCAYGNLYSTVRRKGTDIGFNKIKTILYFLVEKLNSHLNASTENPFYISFYGGEPLIRFNTIVETVEYTKALTFKNNIPVFSMTTNGLLLDKYMDFLAQHDFRLLLSLDGDQNGNSLRVDHQGKPRFDKIFRNIKLLQKKYPDYFKRNVNFNAVLNKYNSVASITEFIENNFGKLPQISSISPQGIQPDKVTDFNSIYVSSVESFKDAGQITDMEEKYFIHHPIVQNAFRFLGSVCNNSYKDYASILAQESKGRIPTGTCLPFGKRIFLSASGLILPCENVSHENAFGKVTESGVELNPGKIAYMYNEAFARLEKQCTQCYGSHFCPECVFQMEAKYQCRNMMKIQDMKARFTQAVTLIENNPQLYVRLMKEVSVV